MNPNFLQSIMALLKNLGAGGQSMGTNIPAGMQVSSQLPQMSQGSPMAPGGGTPGLGALPPKQTSTLENRVAPSPTATPQGSLASMPDFVKNLFGGATGAPPPPQPQAPTAPNVQAPNPWQQALQQAMTQQKKQVADSGFNFGEHPFKSILNAIAAVGQGGGFGMEGRPSPFTEMRERIKSPEYAYGLASKELEGQDIGARLQMAPLETRAKQVGIQKATQDIEQGQQLFPLEVQKLQGEVKDSASRAKYWEAQANRIAASNPLIAQMSKNLAQLYGQKNTLQRQIGAQVNQNDPRISEWKKQIENLDAQIRPLEQQVGIGQPSVGAGQPTQSGQTGAIPFGSLPQ